MLLFELTTFFSSYLNHWQPCHLNEAFNLTSYLCFALLYLSDNAFAIGFTILYIIKRAIYELDDNLMNFSDCSH